MWEREQIKKGCFDRPFSILHLFNVIVWFIYQSLQITAYFVHHLDGSSEIDAPADWVVVGGRSDPSPLERVRGCGHAARAPLPRLPSMSDVYVDFEMGVGVSLTGAEVGHLEGAEGCWCMENTDKNGGMGKIVLEWTCAKLKSNVEQAYCKVAWREKYLMSGRDKIRVGYWCGKLRG